MRKWISFMLLAAMLLPMGSALAAPGRQAAHGQLTPLSGPLEEPSFELKAPSALLVEASSGRIIFEKGADIQRRVASITKLMTLLLTFEAIEEGRLDLGDAVKVTQNAASTGGSQALLDAQSEYAASELIKSVIVASANDASVALAEHIYGSETAFVKRMNGRAAELGLSDTVYKNCTGLTADGDHTTARDVAQLARVLARKELFYDYSGIWLDEIIHPKNNRRTELANTNRLIRTYDGADGLKTGSTSDALFCVAASATRGDMQLIAVVLGAPTSAERFSDAAKMLDYGFDHYYLYEAAQEGLVVREALPVKGGSVREVDIVAGGPVRAMIKKGDEGALSYTAALPEQLEAPLAKGETVGELIVMLDGKQIATIPAVVASEVDNAGFWNIVLRIFSVW